MQLSDFYPECLIVLVSLFKQKRISQLAAWLTVFGSLTPEPLSPELKSVPCVKELTVTQQVTVQAPVQAVKPISPAPSVTSPVQEGAQTARVFSVPADTVPSDTLLAQTVPKDTVSEKADSKKENKYYPPPYQARTKRARSRMIQSYALLDKSEKFQDEANDAKEIGRIGKARRRQNRADKKLEKSMKKVERAKRIDSKILINDADFARRSR
ncbi:hypothetical protein [Tunicatimonas pelagia]|uniref:hypothetical protein n=1 Tax=Tunicatimonas pelagia TaxID=931531 RepID=UPI002665AAF9|nr:hypothetical protein [Tunicatimonas pelagia]WKN45379.1 hypothetical protein P0M28_10465 [Tunicatimonas pelagia]